MDIYSRSYDGCEMKFCDNQSGADVESAVPKQHLESKKEVG